jgi:hypothetical protein
MKNDLVRKDQFARLREAFDVLRDRGVDPSVLSNAQEWAVEQMRRTAVADTENLALRAVRRCQLAVPVASDTRPQQPAPATGTAHAPVPKRSAFAD